MSKEKTLVILAAGMGSRFGGLKQVQPVGPTGELIIDYSIYDAIRAGFSRLVFVIRQENEGEFRTAIGERLSRQLPVEYAFQDLEALPPGVVVPAGRTKPWGTGHAVLAAAASVPGPFAVVNADDFYGSRSFGALGAFLNGAESGPSAYALVGFPLRKTLSEAGAVSRGVCDVSGNGYLRTVTERTRITRSPDGISCAEAGGRIHRLSGDEVVSMNMWAFTPTVFDQLASRFRRFLEAGRGEGNGEFYLPEAINDLVAADAATVRVLPTEDRWFGITYREDLEATRRAIRDLVASGAYPRSLWS